ncbi:MAG: ABC transporter ATP-binding protein [Clostridia bacterium]|nr:ABC transporter ATP-binding protein [Clostridia bacterium]
MKAEKRTLREDLKLILKGYKLLFEICPAGMVWRTVNCITQQIRPYFSLYMSALIINAMAAGAELKELLLLAAVTVLGMLFLNLSMHLISRKAEETESIQWNLNELYLLKVQCKMQYKHFEDPKTALLRQTIRNHANYGGHGLSRLYWTYWSWLSAVINLIFSLSLTISMFRMVDGRNLTGFPAFVNSPLSGLLILGVILGNVLFQLWRIKKFDLKTTEEWNDFNTRFAHSNAFMHGEKPDVKVFGAVGFTLSRSERVLADRGYIRKLFKIGTTSNLLSHCVAAVMNLCLALYVGAKAFIGVFGIGDFVLYLGTVEKFVYAVSELGSSLGILRINNVYMEELFGYIDLPDDMYKGTLSVEKRDDNRFEIEFRDVSFKYPGAEEYALRHINFKFRLGERLAFVGMNGSGKTTFIKLLCRLYDPTEGTILLNGIDITRYDYDQYLSLFSVVFQDFHLFAFSLGENVAASEDYDPARVREALEKAGFGNRLEELEKGTETYLGRGYDESGIDVSGGEAQKIALARALYKDAPFFILDEPTAALDPIAEAEVYSRFDTVAGDKTAVFISHRLSSCKFCHNIAVFHGGEMIQYGSHDDLVADENGQYYKLWHAQAQYYTE